jgi:hypothetical protein
MLGNIAVLWPNCHGPILVCALALMVAVPAAASAAEPVPVDQREALITEAVSEFAQKHYDEALTLFEKAHALRPSARTARALAKCYFEIRQYVKSAQYAELALASLVDPLGDELRKETRELAVRAIAFTATVDVHVQALLHAEVRFAIDGQTVAPGAAPVRVNAGAHQLLVSAGQAHEARTIVVSGGAALIAEFDLRESTNLTRADGSRLSPAWLLVTGAGLLSTGVSTVYLVNRSRAVARCERADSVGASCENVDPIRVERGVAIGWLSASVITSVVGATGLILGLRPRALPRVGCFASPQSVQCAWGATW